MAMMMNMMCNVNNCHFFFPFKTKKAGFLFWNRLLM